MATAAELDAADPLASFHDRFDPAARASHLALTHPDARSLTAELIARDVIVDYREPDVIRFGLSPLTTRFADIDAALQMLQSVSGTPKRDSSPPS